MGRRVIVPVSVDILHYMLTTGTKPACEIRGGLPVDAEFDGAHYDVLTNTFMLRFRHDSFPVSDEGDRITQLHPTLHQATASQQLADAFDRGWAMGRDACRADGPPTDGPPTGGMYLCQRCPAVFSLDVAAERRCPECSSEFVRKWRRGTNPADKICDTPAVVPGS